MAGSSRREFLGQLGSMALAAPVLHPWVTGGPAEPSALAGTGQAGATRLGTPVYDWIIAGGRVIDPAQGLSDVRDVAIAGGRVVRIAADIPRTQARQVYDASGKLVTPGLIDLHTHVYKYGITLNVDPDIVGFQSGVTTVVDCGSTGSGTFQGFRKYVIESSPTRVYALLNISTIGLVVTNEIYLDPRMIDARAAIRTINANRDRILGVKVRVNGKRSDLEHDLEVMKTAREVADATGLPIMMHWSVEPRLLAMLNRGDILAHPFNPPSPNSSNVFGADGPQGEKIVADIIGLRDRGVWVDTQLATTHHSWDVSEKAMKQGWVPDSISTDISRAPDGAPASVLVPMTEFLHLGLPLEKVIAGVTTIPGRMLPFPEKVGTLEPGVTADVAILELQQGSFIYADQTRQTRTVNRQFAAVATMKGGIFLKGAPPPPPAAPGSNAQSPAVR